MKQTIFLLLFTIIFPLFSNDWKDLEEDETKQVYGSEKSKKYPVSNIFGEVEKWDNHYGVRILYLYDYTDYPKYNSTQFFPFYYRINSKLDNREKFRLLNYTSQKEKSETDKSFFPFVFWGGDTKSNRNYQATLPFYSYSKTKNQSLDQTDFIFAPIPFYYKYESKEKETYFKESHFSILHGRTLEKYKTGNKTKETSFWFPIIPLVRYTQLEDSYSHFILPIYGYSKKENPSVEETRFGFSLFPFYYSSSSYPLADKNRHFDKTHWTLFYYRNVEEDTGGFKEYTHKSIWGFPVLPFLFYSSYEQGVGNSKRLFTLIHWGNSPKGQLEKVSVLPLFYYEKDQSFSIPLLLFHKDLSSTTEASGRTFMPLLLYYNKWDTAEQIFVFGPWASTSKNAGLESFSTLFPIYWNFKSEKRDLKLLLPVYANYNDKENDYQFNLLWYTKSSSGVVNPDISIGKKNDKWYFDTDLTILYNVLSLSFRQTLEKPKFLRNVLDRKKSFEEIAEEKKKELSDSKNLPSKQDENSPKLAKKKSISRDDSLNFSGYSALFGIVSYEAADSKRHFRLLPLSWLSWDKDSDDKVYVIPPFFVWFQSDELEYRVAFPFYGKQKDSTSEKNAFLLNAYISETYKENNWKEKSIAWPLINYYTSDIKSGHRVLPFYVHQNYKHNDDERNKNYTLFSFYSNKKDKYRADTFFFFWPSLIYYDSSAPNNPDGKENYKSSTLWITPFFYKSKNENKTHTNFLWFMDIKLSEQNVNTSETKITSIDRLILFPFYYFSNGNYGIFPLSLNSNKVEIWTFTLLNYLEFKEKGFYYNFLFLLEAEKKETGWMSSAFLRGLSLSNSNTEFKFSGLWSLAWNFTKYNYVDQDKKEYNTSFTGLKGYGWNFSSRNDKWEEVTLLSYLGGGYRLDGNDPTYNLSFLFYHQSRQESAYTNWTLGNYRRYSKYGLRNNFLFLADYEYFTKDNSYTLDFLFTGIRYHNFKNENYFQGGYGYVWNFKKENDIWTDASFLWLGYSNKKGETIYNFLPVIRSYEYKDEHSRIYGPLILYTSMEQDKKLHLGLLGLGYWYYKNDKDKSDDIYVLLGSVYREYKGGEQGFRARGSLWGWLWEYQTEETTSFEKFSVLKLFSYVKETDGTKKILGISF